MVLNRIFVAVVLPLLPVGGLVGGCARPASDTLVVGMELADPPFEMTDAQGNPIAIGVSMDMANTLDASLNQKIIIENIPFDGLIVALKSGKIDLIISPMTAAAGRAKCQEFAFSPFRPA